MPMNNRLLRPRENFTPRSIPGLALWFDAADTQTLFQDASASTPAVLQNDPIGRWNDKSGNGRHVTQTVANNRPLLTTENSRTAVYCDGVNDKLSHTMATTVGAGSVTHIAVARNDLVSQPSLLGAEWGFSSGNGGRPITRWQSSGQNSLFANTSLVNVASEFRSRASRFVHVFDGQRDGGGVGSHRLREFFNGALTGSGDTTSQLDMWLTSPQVFNIGSRDDNATRYKGSVCEVICYGRLLTNFERIRIERYLAAKWGVTLA